MKWSWWMIILGLVVISSRIPILFGGGSLPELTAHELYYDFESRDSISVHRYYNQKLSIKGSLAQILPSDLGSAVLLLKTGYPERYVRCFMKEGQQLFTQQLIQDMEIVVEGRCKGYIGDVIIIEGCLKFP